MIDAILIGSGLCLAAVGLWDQFWTILGEGGGPVTRRVAKGIWAGARQLHRLWPHSRLLSAGGAGTVLGTIVCWVFIQWLAWTLVFVGLDGGVVDAAAGEPADFWERAYFAGYTLSTLGIGDVQPRGAVARLLTAVVSFNGLVQISFGVGYLVPVVVAATDKRRVSIQISSLGTSSTALLTNAWDGHSLEALRPYLEALAPELARLEQKYRSYPVLPYLHGHKRPEAIGPSLAVLDEAVTLLRYGVPPEHTGIPDGTIHTLRRSLSTLLETLATALNQGPNEAPEPPSLEDLREAGIPTVCDEAFRSEVDGLADRRRTLLKIVWEDSWDWDAVTTANEGRDDEQLTSLYDTEAV